MKKIININLSGRVIPIEDSAYEKLQNYIDSLRRYFAHEEGRDEIINDIESRIAELMNEKVRKSGGAITDADVDEIAASMGKVEDFEAEAAAEAAESARPTGEKEYTRTERKRHGRLYRDSSDKFIGGVCSGIANYLNTDPAIVRILFAIITFGGFGFGFLIYLLLWIVLPEKDLENFSGKRLYRNPDDRVIGGVAGGLAAYFGTNSTTLRWIFAAPLLLSIFFSMLSGFTWHYDFNIFPNIVFGSLSGTFILAYIILWMVLPEARSTYEKMEMRGEKVDVNTIRQNVQEGLGSVKDRVHGWTEEVKESAQNISAKAREFANTRGKQFASEVSEQARSGGRGIGHAIGVLFKAFFLFVAGTIAFGLFVGLIALIFGGVAWWPINDFLWTSEWQKAYAWGTVLLFFGVPLIGFIVWIIRRILRVRSKNNYLGWIFGSLWAIGWVAATLLVTSIVKDFRIKEHYDVPVTLTAPAANNMIVAVSQPELQYSGTFGWIDDDATGWDLARDSMRLSNISFDTKASPDSFYHVTIRKYAFGSSDDEAIERAQAIKYSVISRDSVLDLGNGYAIFKENKFRGQHVEIEIMIPVGKKIRFDESIRSKLNPADFRVRRSYRSRNGIDIHYDRDYSFRFRTGVDYTMGIDGRLTSDGKAVEEKGYRYDQQDSNQINIEIERRKQEIRELEERKKSSSRISTAPESMDDTDGDLADNRSSILSYIGTYF